MSPWEPLESKDVASVKRRYTQFWQKIRSFTDGRAQTFSDRALVATFQRDFGGSICVQTPLHEAALRISGLPIRPDTSMEDLDVYIKFTQVVQAESNNGDRGLIAIKSNIKLLYFDTNNERCGLHFDLSGEDQHDHPVYHAQIDTSCIPPDAVSRRYDGTQRSILSRYPRIPTAPMDLAAVVYLILRDHLPSRVRNGWPGELRGAAYALPHLPSDHFQEHLKPQHKVECLWWYRRSSSLR